VYNGSGGLLTNIQLGVCRDLADYQPTYHLVYAGVRQIHWLNISSVINGSGGLLTKYSFGDAGIGGLLTEYSFGVCRGQADYQSDIHNWLGRSELNIYHWTDWIGGSEWIFIVGMIGHNLITCGFPEFTYTFWYPASTTLSNLNSLLDPLRALLD